MDIALCIDKLLPAAQYGGVPGKTEEEYNALRWEDDRTKPTWQAIQDAWVLVQVDIANEIVLRQLSATDTTIPRPLEDVIDLLITKNTIIKADLPQAVQTTYDLKKSLRATLV
jgi:hypothetical protein